MSDTEHAIKVEIDPCTILPQRYLGHCDGGPISLYDAIIDAAVSALVGVSETELRKLVRERMKESVQQQIDARLPEIIDEVFSSEVTVGDGFTEKTKSIRQVIADRVREQARPASSRNDPTVFDRVMREQVDVALTRLLSAEVKVAREAMRDALRQKASELLAAETIRGAGL